MSDSQYENLDIRVVKAAGYTLVAGLLWEQLSKVRSYMAEARDVGKRLGMDVVAIRKGDVAVQAGYSPKNTGALKGMYSLAAAVSSVVGKNALIAFRLPELSPDGEQQYGLVATFDDLIVAGSDMIGSLEEVEQEFRGFYSRLDNWDRVAAPEEFEAAHDEFDLEEELRGNVDKDCRLQALTLGLSKAEWTKYGVGAAIAVVVAVAAVYGLHVYKQHRARAAAVEAMRRAKAQALALAAHQQHAPTSLPHPWAKQPQVPYFLEACAQQRHQVPLSVGGWLLFSIRCTDQTMGVTYRRANDVAFDAFRDASMKTFGVPATVQNTSKFDEGSLGMRFQVPGDLQDEGVKPELAALSDFYSHFQALGFEVHLVAPKPPKPAKNGKKPEGLQPDWKTYSFDIDTAKVDRDGVYKKAPPLTPALLFQGMDTKGLRIDTIITTLNAKTAELSWEIKGKLYVR